MLNQELTQAIYQNMINAENNPDKFNPCHLRMSETGYHPNYRIAKMMGLYEPEHTIEEKLRFARGHWMEDIFFQQYVGGNICRGWFEREYPVELRTPKGRRIYGHMDLIDTRDGGEITELKSATDSVLDASPSHINVAQCNAYWAAINQQNLPYQRVNLVVISSTGRKDAQCYPIAYSEEKTQEILKVADLIFDWVELHKDDKKLPDNSYWKDNGIDTKHLAMPVDYSRFLYRQRTEGIDNDFGCPDFIDDECDKFIEDSKKVAYQLKLAKERGDEKLEKQLRKEMEIYLNEGLTYFEFDAAQPGEIGTATATWRVDKGKVNVNKLEKCNMQHLITEEFKPYIKESAGWVITLNKKKEDK